MATPKPSSTSIPRKSVVKSTSRVSAAVEKKRISTSQTIAESVEDSFASTDPSYLAVILNMSLSTSSLDTSRASLLHNVPSMEVDYDFVLKDKVIEEPYFATLGSVADGQLLRKLPTKMDRRSFLPSRVKPRPLIGQCTRQQVSKMGNRRVPLHEATDEQSNTFSPFCGPHSSGNQILPAPKCYYYEAWLLQKRQRQEEAFETLTLDDVVHLHRTCQPGQVGLAIAFDALGLPNRHKPPTRAFEVSSGSARPLITLSTDGDEARNQEILHDDGTDENKI